MKEIIEGEFNTRLYPSDWRWSAAIVGVSKYLKGCDLGYNQTDDYLEFNIEEITDEKYLIFTEGYFRDSMHHKKVEDLLETTWSEEDQRIEKVNEKLSKNTSTNTIMLKTFKGIEYNGQNNMDIKEIIDRNRLKLINDTFKGGRSLYYNFCNENSLLKEDRNSCRIRGYSLDMSKKGKSVSYMRDTSTFVYSDDKLFDFIPFAFSKTREAFFINNNFTLEQLIKTNSWDSHDRTEAGKNMRSNLFYRVKEGVNFIDYDVEIIYKEREKDYFETIYVREKARKVFDKINDKQLKALRKPCKIKNDFIKIEKIVTDNILNEVKLDDLIDMLLKEGNKSYLISHLIKINELIYRGVTDKQKTAYASAVQIRKALKNNPNKVRAYEQRLIRAITLKDYDGVCEILLYLSIYTQVSIEVAIDLFENFEDNKNLAYTFINTLGEKKKFKGEQK
ncbi:MULTISPECIES: type I CRISPR-associated protein Cas8a1/Csx8 [Psychrilyobacter]|uniref:Type I CRISPR-associated protein Cas8a1/Csx8 n=1 Tax=Psychrilyobacter piezotolerans TaxID=2293438 RepID=A0ABX9KFQ6_9FUSO|nr:MULTISPECIES: type I CRISPR-associated protein Cas8a1/Csx8 [Psychrilyobacter]MCS5420967.1 type I CRISPR-associated protein Cas8a1/Csx8 [Psychrilyobacter sp. S5]NDI78768.1 type I CRISPR-associated protein Cas8a1/Csx8 [Psychrilyobacter piezotolerans]RDE60869.1 type I CRISPR-associated protein Cas8a1/Csx8 [Psychrilyobacter sp. S5]REI40658.1 type I CRISPR-associated protein Cas8a1/Csx8 [Psychrilyobacter piezotolerans]